MNLLDLLSLLLGIVALVLLQTPLLLGTMVALHRFLEPTDFGEFNFSTYTQETLQKLLLHKILPITAASAVGLSLLGAVMAQLTPGWGWGSYLTVGFVLTALQFGVFYAGFNYWVRLDVKKSAILAGANTLFYIIMYLVIVGKVIR